MTNERDRSPCTDGRPAPGLAVRAAAMVTLLAAPLLLACGPVEPDAGVGTSSAERAFAIDHVVVGVGFDEHVRVEGSGTGPAAANAEEGEAAVQLAEVVLTQAADAGRYTGVVRFAASEGDTAEIRLFVDVGEAVDGVAGGVAADATDPSARSAGSVVD